MSHDQQKATWKDPTLSAICQSHCTIDLHTAMAKRSRRSIVQMLAKRGTSITSKKGHFRSLQQRRHIPDGYNGTTISNFELYLQSLLILQLVRRVALRSSCTPTTPRQAHINVCTAWKPLSHHPLIPRIPVMA